MSTDGPARLPYEPGLDGVRGIAVGAVLLFHAGFGWMVGGYLGVSTFFTLSGFLITALLVTERERSGRIDLGRFWERRFRRIMPAAYLALAGIVVFGATVADGYQEARLRGDGLAALLYGVNWWLIASRRDYMDIFASPSPVQHFWSLAIEEQFYLVFPVLVAVVLRTARGSRRALAAVLVALALGSALAMLLLARTDVPTARLYYGTDTRAVELLAGALLALVLTGRGPSAALERVRGALGIAGLVVSVLFWTTMSEDDARLYEGGLVLYTAATTALLSATVLPSGPVRALLSLAPLRWLGRVSYATYLYHFPIYLWLTPERTGLADLPLLVLRVTVTLVLAAISYRWLEWPVRSGRVVRGRQRWVVPAAAALAIALVLVGTTARAPLALAPPPSPPPGSEASLAPDAVRVMVIGDSVAEGIAAGLARWGRQTGRLAVADLTQSGCGIARGGRVAARDTQMRAAECDDWSARWEAALEQFRPELIVVYTGGWDLVEREFPAWGGVRNIGDPEYDRWLRAEYAAAIDAFASHGARVVWLSSLCVRARMVGPVGVFDPERVRRLNRTIAAAVADRRDADATVVDLFAPLCPRGRFTNVVDGIADIRPDGVHLSEAGADWVARWLGPRLLREAAATGRDASRGARAP